MAWLASEERYVRQRHQAKPRRVAAASELENLLEQPKGEADALQKDGSNPAMAECHLMAVVACSSGARQRDAVRGRAG